MTKTEREGKGEKGRVGLPGKVLEAEDYWQLSNIGDIRGMSKLQLGVYTHVGIGYGLQTNAKTNVKWLQGLDE